MGVEGSVTLRTAATAGVALVPWHLLDVATFQSQPGEPPLPKTVEHRHHRVVLRDLGVHHPGRQRQPMIGIRRKRGDRSAAKGLQFSKAPA
jgi:hypothetical protein